MALAVNADVDALSAFTARILAIHLRLEIGFIDKKMQMRALRGRLEHLRVCNAEKIGGRNGKEPARFIRI